MADNRSTDTESPTDRIAGTSEITDTTPDRALLVAILATVFAGLVTLLATSQGAGLGADSVNYLSSGLNLAAGHGLRTFNGTTLTLFPPGLPAVVAAGDMVGLTAQWSIRILNSLSFAATVWLGYVLVRRHVRSRGVVIATTVLLAVSVTLLGIARMALTECVYVAVSLALILVLEQVIETRSRLVPWLAAAAALVWAGFMIRYAGIALIPAGAAAILWGRRSLGWLVAVATAAAFSAASMVVPTIWMVRNHRISGNLLGPRAPSPDGPILTMQRFVATLGRWVLPKPTPVSVQAVAGVGLILGCIALAVWALAHPGRRTALRSLPRTGPSIAPMVTSVVVYSAYLVLAQLTTAFDPIGTRLMAPIYVPLVVLLALSFDRATQLVPTAHRLRVRNVAAALFAMFLVAQTVFYANDAITSGRNGIEYTARTWNESDFVAAVRDVPDDADLYSNVPAGIWAVLQREPIRRSPEKSQRRGSGSVEMSEQFLSRVACNDTYLAWSDDAVGDYLYTPGQLRDYVELEVVAETSSGTVYRVLPLAASERGDVAC